MCITTNNPSEPCCDGASRCVACPRVDWSQYTFHLSYDSYFAGTTRPAVSRKMTYLSACQWQLETQPFLDVSTHLNKIIHLIRKRSFYDLDGQWWRILISTVSTGPLDGGGFAPISFDPFLCSGLMTLQTSQDRYDELFAQDDDAVIPLDQLPSEFRIQRVLGSGPTLENPLLI